MASTRPSRVPTSTPNSVQYVQSNHLRKSVKSVITKVKARQILDSKGISTVEVDLHTNKGVFRASVPSGSSSGIFIYMGLDVFTEQHNWSHIRFIFFSVIFIVVARAANVFSCGYLVNLVRPTHRKIPMKHQKALWYSGLRGAMAFALALQSLHDLPEGHGQTIFTATTSSVVLTV